MPISSQKRRMLRISRMTLRIVVVEVRLVVVEPMPEILLGDRVPGPVRRLGVDEDDPGFLVALIGIAPDVEVAMRRAGLGLARPLEPRVLVGGVVDHQLGDHAQAALVGGAHEAPEVAHRAVRRVDVAVVGDVVAVVAQRRRIERQDPDRIDAELLDVVELLHQAGKVADAVVVGIEERFDVQLIDDGVFVPVGLAAIDHSGPWSRRCVRVQALSPAVRAA